MTKRATWKMIGAARVEEYIVFGVVEYEGHTEFHVVCRGEFEFCKYKLKEMRGGKRFGTPHTEMMKAKDFDTLPWHPTGMTQSYDVKTGKSIIEAVRLGFWPIGPGFK